MWTPKPVRYRNNGTQYGSGMLRYRTEMQDVECRYQAMLTAHTDICGLYCFQLHII
jgi:hypothetical protein